MKSSRESRCPPGLIPPGRTWSCVKQRDLDLEPGLGLQSVLAIGECEEPDMRAGIFGTYLISGTSILISPIALHHKIRALLTALSQTFEESLKDTPIIQMCLEVLES
jgi:hypothetical protein